MIFHLGKKRRKLACHRHMGWVFAHGGPSSSCCLLPLLRSVSPEDTPAFTYFEGEYSRGNLNYFYDFWRHFCSRTCHVQVKDRPGSGHYPMWMKFGGSDGGSVLHPSGYGSAWCAWPIILSPGCPLPSHPSLRCLGHKWCSSSASAVLGTWALCKSCCRAREQLSWVEQWLSPPYFL